MIVGKICRRPIDVERVEVRRRISLYHNRHRAKQRRAVTILGGRGRTGGIGHGTGPEQDQAVGTLRLELML
jgi:hypothetical protein